MTEGVTCTVEECPGAVACIVTATLDEAAGRAACELARRTAGQPCHTVVACDSRRRGDTIPTNTGFRQALDLGARYVALINDDVRAEQEGWGSRLIEALESEPRYGIAAPGGRCRSKSQRSARPGLPPGIQVVRYLSFFCAVVKREVFEAIGLWDTRFIHYGNDTDFCLRAQASGWKCIWVQDVYLKHDLGNIITEWKERDVAVFREKWKDRR